MLVRTPSKSNHCDFMKMCCPSLESKSAKATGALKVFSKVVRLLVVPGILSSITFSMSLTPLVGLSARNRQPPSRYIERPATQ